MVLFLVSPIFLTPPSPPKKKNPWYVSCSSHPLCFVCERNEWYIRSKRDKNYGRNILFIGKLALGAISKFTGLNSISEGGFFSPILKKGIIGYQLNVLEIEIRYIRDRMNTYSKKYVFIAAVLPNVLTLAISSDVTFRWCNNLPEI